MFTSTNFGDQETDVNSMGKTIGFDDLNVAFMGPSGTGHVAGDFEGGFLYGTIATTNAGQTFSGKVTGGTGPYKGATGRITAKAISSTQAAVTITYTTSDTAASKGRDGPGTEAVPPCQAKIN